MPTYIYECESNASHRYEKMQKFSDTPDTVCPMCGGTVHRVITGGVGLIFNGKGFYQTDYKGANASTNGNAHKHEHHEHKDSESKSESKSESGTDTKTSGGGCGPGCSCHN